MLGNFSYKNATKLYFGDDSLKYLNEELPKYGKNVQLIYGGGSIKKNGIYDEIIKILKDNGKNIIEDPGVMPNPTIEKLREGIKIARDNKTDLLLAVGGGSCCDYAKAVSVSVNCDEDPWDKYYIRFEEPTCDILPVGCILTMAGTGSEMNAGAVITNHEQKLKIGHVFGEEVMPRFSILNPRFTFSLPKRQMVAGIYDIFNHICEQYFSGEDDNTSDYIAEALMKSLIHSSLIAVEDPENYEARATLMWAGSLSHNDITGSGRQYMMQVHQTEHELSGYDDKIAHDYRYVMPYGLKKFKRFAEEVWNISSNGLSDEQVANEGLKAMESWMKKIGVAMNISELGATEDMIDGITEGTLILEGGYKVLTKDEIRQILKKSL